MQHLGAQAQIGLANVCTARQPASNRCLHSVVEGPARLSVADRRLEPSCCHACSFLGPAPGCLGPQAALSAGPLATAGQIVQWCAIQDVLAAAGTACRTSPASHQHATIDSDWPLHPSQQHQSEAGSLTVLKHSVEMCIRCEHNQNSPWGLSAAQTLQTAAWPEA